MDNTELNGANMEMASNVSHPSRIVETRPPIALVFGITGQDASYMCELLLEKGYTVHGTMRRSSTPNTSNVNRIISSIHTHLMDLTDASSVEKVVSEVRPDIMFCLAAQSDVRASYDIPLYTADATGLGFARIMEAARKHCPTARIYQAGSSEMFGKVQAVPQNEETKFWPRSPYGCAKVFAFSMGRAYREGYGMRVYNGILFNHESPRRGHLFVTRKIVKAAVAIKNGRQSKIRLGNLQAKRDWGYSKNYMRIIYDFVTTQEPQDFVVATGETHTIEEFVKETFDCLGLGDWRPYVEFDRNLTRPAEVDLLLGDMSKVRGLLGYDPVTVRFKDLVKLMCDEEQNETANN